VALSAYVIDVSNFLLPMGVGDVVEAIFRACFQKPLDHDQFWKIFTRRCMRYEYGRTQQSSVHLSPSQSIAVDFIAANLIREIGGRKNRGAEPGAQCVDQQTPGVAPGWGSKKKEAAQRSLPPVAQTGGQQAVISGCAVR
jgi:hypothetical protein